MLSRIIDRDIDDVATIDNINSPADCQRRCQQDDKCQAFFYNAENWANTCSLKGRPLEQAQRRMTGLDHVSGPKECGMKRSYFLTLEQYFF